jgi:outer membrane protein assembly factor BamB
VRARCWSLAALAGLALLLVGCANVASPEGWSPPTLDEEGGELLFVSMSDGKISALNAEDYSIVWEFPESDDFACGTEAEETHDLEGIYGAPAIGEDLVYIGAYNGDVYALTKEDGACQWSFSTDDPIVGGLVLGDGRLFVPSTDGRLYLVNPETGEEIQRIDTGEIWATPTFADGYIYVSTMDGEVWKLATDPTVPGWEGQFKVSAGLLTQPTLAEDLVLAGGIGGNLYGINAATGEESWSFGGARNWYWGRPFVDGDLIYASNLDGKVYAVNAATGEEVWSFDTKGEIRSAPVISGDTLVVVNIAGEVFGLAPETGEPRWDTELEQTVHADPLAVDNGTLIVSRRGNLFLLDEEGLPTEVAD